MVEDQRLIGKLVDLGQSVHCRLQGRIQELLKGPGGGGGQCPRKGRSVGIFKQTSNKTSECVCEKVKGEKWTYAPRWKVDLCLHTGAEIFIYAKWKIHHNSCESCENWKKEET